MGKLPMCRLCLSENVRMYVVVNKDLHKLYERLTDHPFVTEDSRPMLACFICCTKLKQCCQLQRQCLEAEELLTQMRNEDYELNSPFIGELEDHLGHYNELIISPMVHVSIDSDDECQTEGDAIKEELPDVCERLDDVIKPKEEVEEHHSGELEMENLFSSSSHAQDTPAQQSESDSDDYVPIIKIKTEAEEEEQEVSRKKRRASDTTRSAAAKKPKRYIQGIKVEDIMTEYQKKNEESASKVAQNTKYCVPKVIPKTQEPITNTTSRVNISVTDTTIDTNCPNNIESRDLKKHPCIRTGGVTYKCDMCQYSCNKKRNLIGHIRLHTGEKPYKCGECQRCFSHRSSLKYHISTHTGEKPFKCIECQRCFSVKIHLTTHIRTHTGEKPYKCEECQLRFSLKSSLKKHIRLHTGEKPYKCEECQLRFSHNSSLKYHIITHTGEKPFKCMECQRCFMVKSQLTAHIRTHTGEKPYKCEECQRCFSKKCTLTHHARRKHAA